MNDQPLEEENGSLLPAERHLRILEALERQGTVRVNELARQFAVTEETIRRDLNRLENEGRIKRSHGGAIFVRSDEEESPYWLREVRNEHEKSLIAREAVRRIEEGDRIMLDASSTALYVAKRIPDMNLTVITNSLQAVTVLGRLRKVETIVIGGNLAPRSLSSVGPGAETMLERYHADKVFLSCRGLDLERGIYDNTEAQANIRRLMIRHSDRRYLMMDSTKYGVRSLVIVDRMEAFQEILTDDGLSEDYRVIMKEKAMPLTIVSHR